MNIHQPLVSLVINTKNEEKNLKSCVKSVAGFYDEIVVVDMHSSDKTVQIAKSLGARVIRVKDSGYVEPARQKAIESAKGKWIMILDADERLTKKFIRIAKKLIMDESKEAIALPTKNIIFGKWIKGAGYWPNYHVRLFRRGLVTWSNKIHGEPKVKGEVYKIPALGCLAIKHLVNVDPDRILAKTDAYSSYEKNFENVVKNRGFSSDVVLNYIAQQFRYDFVDQKGYKDGFRGYILSKLMEIYRFAEVIKYWLKHGLPLMADEKDFINKLLLEQEYLNSRTFKYWLKLKLVRNKLGL